MGKAGRRRGAAHRKGVAVKGTRQESPEELQKRSIREKAVEICQAPRVRNGLVVPVR